MLCGPSNMSLWWNRLHNYCRVAVADEDERRAPAEEPVLQNVLSLFSVAALGVPSSSSLRLWRLHRGES